jgi:hypothetical protein
VTTARFRPEALLFVALSTLYLITVSGHYGGDGFHSYLTAESLVLDGDLAILDRPFRVDEMVRGARLSGRIGRDGRRYSISGLALPLAEAPLYAVGRGAARLVPSVPSDYVTMAAVSTLNAFVTAAIGALLLAAARRRGLRGAAALLPPLAFAVGSFAWGNSRIGYNEPLLALLLLASFLAVEGARTRRGFAAAGALLGLAVHAKAYAVVLVPLFVAYAATRRPSGPARRAALFAFAAPAAAALALLAAANAARFGHPLATGYALTVGRGVGDDFDPRPIAGRLLALLVSPGKGALWYAPFLALVPFRFGRLARERRGEARFLLALAATYFAVFGSAAVWHGDFAWGPRHLYPLVAFLTLALCVPSESARRERPASPDVPVRRGEGARGRLGALGPLVALGALVEIPVLVLNFSRHLEQFPPNEIPYWSVTASPIVANWAALVSSLGRMDEWDVWFSTVPRLAPFRAAPLAALGGVVLLAALSTAAFAVLVRRLRSDAPAPDRAP